MNLLVTGGAGFIGASFVLLMLARHPDWRITVLDKLTYCGNPENLAPARDEHMDRFAFVQGDIGDAELVAELLEAHAIDAVVNFAAETHVDRSIHDAAPFLTTNVLGTQTLLETARRLGTPRFVHVSTDEVYGTLGPTGKFTEETPLEPNSP
jgi:dTDP-glucose 4,6-dehydratase